MDLINFRRLVFIVLSFFYGLRDCKLVRLLVSVVLVGMCVFYRESFLV